VANRFNREFSHLNLSFLFSKNDWIIYTKRANYQALKRFFLKKARGMATVCRQCIGFGKYP
ncbi:MAG: hypothetical protein IKS34_05320, partial [Clostridia bacterium]|nr:hypothetical protein [Clostridia bacterium]